MSGAGSVRVSEAGAGGGRSAVDHGPAPVSALVPPELGAYRSVAVSPPGRAAYVAGLGAGGAAARAAGSCSPTGRRPSAVPGPWANGFGH
ncbi:hypothetical protein ACFQVD_25035 [Streptosporangium amethystogenes subsp. fukuiense]|uniref:Uncharacterized protein n=1 Tax=Streptosporangium amethystogenes subsp. fukuiense TaxID=698418 RepID=A0ABW2T5G1_9ACTN